MKFRLFYHSLVSDWNHGNAHFLRGVVAELIARGHDVRVFEPHDGWSRRHLQQHSSSALADFHAAFPQLTSHDYAPDDETLESWVDDADVVIVHEWTEASVLARLAAHRTRQARYLLLFHDTHHRAVSDPDALAALPIERCDGVLAFGASLAEQYRRLGWGSRVWVWHEAADTRVFKPLRAAPERDLVWIGNWGDDERAEEIEAFLLQPVAALGARARVHGGRYPPEALERLREAGIEYAGWLANYRVPAAFARARATVHIPRRPYTRLLPGIPTIRVFEALACGIPLVSAPWDDCEALFRPGDFMMVSTGEEMMAALARVLKDADYARGLAERGLETIQARHTCAHRVDELLAIVASLASPPAYQEVR
jgi:spore maturation protein CgeB